MLKHSILNQNNKEETKVYFTMAKNKLIQSQKQDINQI
jgi:hypothetical protein